MMNPTNIELTEGPKTIVIEECPPPPFYFSLFDSCDSFQPPVLPSDMSTLMIPFSHLHENIVHEIDITNFKYDLTT